MTSCNRNALILLGFVLPLCFLLAACDQAENSVAEVSAKPEKVVPVSVEVVRPGDLTEHFTLPATLEAWEDLQISAEIAGPVTEIHFQEGDSVQAGQVLLEIDSQTLSSTLVREEENYAVTLRKLERYQQLAAEGLVSEQELDELKNSVTAAESALKLTRVQLAKYSPQAPVSGVVDRHYVDRGEYVDPGQPLLRIVQIDKLKVIAEVPEKDVPYLQVGQRVEIIPAIINQLTGHTVIGRIAHIAFSADPSTRTYRTKMLIDNQARRLRPGMIVRARFVRQELAQVISVPLYAVVERDGEKSVFVEADGIARQLEIETGSSVGERIVVTSGLEEGQRLIIKGQQLLINGAKVAVEGS